MGAELARGKLDSGSDADKDDSVAVRLRSAGYLKQGCCVPRAPCVPLRMQFALATIVLLLALAPSWLRFPAVWGASREHGFAVALLCLWLLWLRRGALGRRAGSVPLAMPAVAVASVGWWIAMEAGLQAGHLLLTPLIGVLWLAAAAGAPAAIAASPIALTFLLAVPIWEVLIPVLQWMTVAANQIVLGAIGINAQIKDTFIILRAGTLVVADSCSGLNFLLVGSTIGAAYGWLFVDSTRTRIRILATAVALSLIANWVRVFGLVLVADATSMRSPLMADHEFFGWSIFLGALLVFFVIARRLERSDTRVTISEGLGDGATVETVSRGRLFGATALAGLGPVAMVLLAAMPAVSTTSPPDLGLVLGPQWRQVRDPSVFRPPAVFAGAAPSSQVVSNGIATVRIDRYLYATTSADAELISASNHVAPDSAILRTRTVGPLDQTFRLVQETALRDGERIVLVWSWYRIGDRTTWSPLRGKLFQFMAALERRADSEAVLLSTACNGTDCEAAAASLFTLVTGRPFPRRSAPPTVTQ